MFNHTHHKIKVPNTRPLKDLTVVVSASQLLSDSRRQQLIDKISEQSALDSSKFEHLCLHLIKELAQYCQNLPETANSYYSSLGGYLDNVLNRTEAALTLFRQYIITPTKEAELSEEQTLWVYALFSAGILQGIGKLQLDYAVDLFDSNGQLIKRWNPLLEDLTSAHFYHFEFQKEGEHALCCRLNLLLARQLMPPNGFAWIASHPDVLNVWLALLSEDSRTAGTLGAILNRAKVIAMQRDLNDITLKNTTAPSRRTNLITTFVETIPESTTGKERLIAATFIQWLLNKLASGQILLNKTPLRMVPGGLLMSTDVYKWFVREHPEYKNWQAAQRALLTLDSSKQQHLNKKSDTKTDTLFTHFGVALPDHVPLYDTSTHTVSLISAVEIMYLAETNHAALNQGHNLTTLDHLAPSGEWQALINDTDASLQKGNTFHG